MTAPEPDPAPRQDDPFVAHLSAWEAAGTDPPAPGPPADVPRRIGRFRVRRELGRGGFGVVFLAYDPRLRRRVALKVPRADALAAPEFRERFQTEARAAAGLAHPNLVPVSDAGQAGPVCHIASAYCPGPTLRHRLRPRKAPVPLAVAAELVAALADGRARHGRGVVHRDSRRPTSPCPYPWPSPAGTRGAGSSAGTRPKITPQLLRPGGRPGRFGAVRVRQLHAGAAGEGVVHQPASTCTRRGDLFMSAHGPSSS